MESAQRRDARVGRFVCSKSEASHAQADAHRAGWRATLAQVKSLLRSTRQTAGLLPLVARLEQQLLLGESDSVATETVLTELLLNQRPTNLNAEV